MSTSVKQLLQKHGYGMVWLNQGVEDNSHFIVEFEQRLKDSFINLNQYMCNLFWKDANTAKHLLVQVQI